MKTLIATLAVAAVFVAMIFAWQSGQDRQCRWMKQHHYAQASRYCGH